MCHLDTQDCLDKMNEFPYRHVLKSGHFIPLTDNITFSKAYSDYIEANNKPDIMKETNYFVISLDINVLYPLLDGSTNCFKFKNFSTTFPIRPSPIPAHFPPQTPTI